MIVFFTMALIVAMAGCGKDHGDPANTKTYVIVPGAWSAPYAWLNVKSMLEAQGQKVVIVQLQGHGSDQTKFSTIHLQNYRDRVIQVIDSLNTKVILVGHSLAGMVITEVAEKVPLKIEKMIYVAAFLPANNQSLLDLANTDGNSLLGPNIGSVDALVTLDVPRDKLNDIFIQDGSSTIKALVAANYKSEPGLPFKDSVTISNANFGSVDKYYIHTLQDHAVSYPLQKRMVAAAGLSKTYQINTSHSPFLAKPDSLTILLQNITR